MVARMKDERRALSTGPEIRQPYALVDVPNTNLDFSKMRRILFLRAARRSRLSIATCVPVRAAALEAAERR
jgi:hypothetical protein